MGRYCIGIDLGGTTVKFGLFDLTGHLYHKWQIPTDTTESGKYILGNLADSLKKQLEISQVNGSEVIGIGIGVPGLVTGNGYVSVAVNLGWTNVDVTKELTNRMGIVVKTCNDANAAAMGEMWQGSGKGYKNLVMLTLGTGIGGGIIIKEQVVSGLNGAAGEFGHMPVVQDKAVRCNCGNMGCLEQVASATGIVKEASRFLLEYKVESSLRNLDDITVPKIFEAAKAGDWIASKVMNQAGRHLGIAMASITAVIDPDLYIIGGGVSRAGQPLIDMIQKYYKEYVLPTCKGTEIKLAALGNDAGIYGAARIVL